MSGYTVYLQIILFVVLLVGTKCEVEYVIGFNDRVASCPDFTNQYLQGDSIKLAKSSDGETDSMSLEGIVNCMEPLGKGDMIGIEIAKETDMGSEPLWSCAMDLCGSIEDKDAPWAAMFEAVNIKACPIEKADYTVEKLMIDAGFTKDFLNEEYVGEYQVLFTILNDKMDKIACHVLSIAIKQKEEE